MVYINESLTRVEKSTALNLFTDGRAIKTLLLWLCFGMLMLMVYGVNTWLPKMMNVGGYSLGSSITFLVVLNIGNIFGTMLFGVLADRWGPKITLIFGFLVCAFSISLLGFHPPTTLLYILLLLAGGVMFGSLSVIHGLAADFYPTHIRSTGIGFAAAMGRFGAIAGPLVGGSVLAMNLPFEQNFMVFAVPGLIGAIAISFFIQKKTFLHSTWNKTR
ncbi:MFS transporter [Acinetobacter calcoaceticus]|uniref:MFS transporter n=1 Tax=Acinetobacter calcoaceticus TaxID=471 RepID=A0A4R1XTG5_ACICA|nr:MFS transporter [Acinetobacter calcoaceticus]